MARAARRSLPLLLVLLAGCTLARTEVLVELDTDLPQQDETGDQLRVRLQVEPASGGVAGFAYSNTVGPDESQVHLPGSFGIVPGSAEPTEPVRLTVDAHVGPRNVHRVVVFRFVRHETLHLPVFLNARCAD